MIAGKCPGQDTRYWTAEDIHEQPCPHCGEMIEFWKTDIRVRCPNCKQKAVNPRFNLGCAEWCAYAEQCLGAVARGQVPRSLRHVLDSELSRLAHGLPLQIKAIKEQMARAEEKCRAAQSDPLPVLGAIVIRELQKLGRLGDAAAFVETLTREHQFPVAAGAEILDLLGKAAAGGSKDEHESPLSPAL